MHKCPLCDQFERCKMIDIRLHLKQAHHVLVGYGDCGLCQNSHSDLLQHIIDNHVVLTESLQTMNPRLTYRPGQFPCHWCQRSFTTKTNRSRHEVSIHKIGTSHKCVMCPYTTSRKYLLRDHVFSKHGINNESDSIYVL